MRRQVIGGAAGGRRHQDAVADQFGHAHLAVDPDAQLCRLTGLSQQGNFIDRDRSCRVSLDILNRHFQRAQFDLLGGGEALDQAGLAVFVHQEPDRTAVHPVNRYVAFEKCVQGFEHMAVAAERDDHVRFFRRHMVVFGGQFFIGLLRRIGCRGDKGYFRSSHTRSPFLLDSASISPSARRARAQGN